MHRAWGGRRRGAFVAAALLLGACSGGGDDPVADDPVAATVAFGMRTNGGFFDLDEYRRTESWLGRKIAYTVQFTGRRSPRAMNSAAFGLLAGPQASLPEVADELSLVITVALAFDEGGDDDVESTDDLTDDRTPKESVEATSEATAESARKLADTAAGAHDDAYRRVAIRLIEAGYPDAIVRLGHEFNGAWPPWSAIGHEELYVDAWRHVHEVFRRESPDFRFDWTAMRADWAGTAPAAYPGDEYVDFIGIDIYWRGNAPFTESRWTREYLAHLQPHFEFARERGKPVSYPEWGLSGRDEPAFIEAMFDWFVSLPDSGPGSLGYHAFFDGGGNFALTNYPEAEARFGRLFGASSAPASSP